MLVEEVRLSRSIMQRNYSHCPLKKRPVPLSAREERPPAVTYKYEQEMDDNEPENLSTKPEDLSRTGNYPSKASSPAVGAAPAPSPPRYWYSMPAQSPVTTHLQPHVPAHVTSAPLSPYLPTHLPAQLPAHLSAHLSAHLPAHLPTHLPAHLQTHLPAHFPAQLPPYPSRPVPLEPLNLNSPTEQYCSWPRPSPPYTTYLPTGYPDSYSGLSPRTACSPPAHSHHSHSSHSPHSPHSPPALSPVSLSSGPTSPGAGELSPPGSVSSDSGISAGSAPRRRRESAARYQCPDCGKSYSTYSGLSKHSQFHCAAAEGNLAKKSFSCKYCSKVYTSLGALKMHIRTHTLPCKCHLCGKAFSRPWLLQGHIRTHTGEKPFSCHHCRRAFADRSNLRAHLQTHSEVKKYSCVSCSKTFSRMSLLSKHLEGGCPGYCPSGAPPPYEYRSEEMAAY